jgi:intracellular sulfur oxidation DsrE/DsrF family protein
MNRSTFIAAGAAGVTIASAVAPSIAAAATPAALVPGALHFDRPAFEAVLARPFRHHQVFATTRLDDGVVLHYMENSLKAYAEGFGEGPGTLHVAAVMYGTSLAVAMNDNMWTKYGIGAVLDKMTKDLKPADALAKETKNPFAARVTALMTGGASFFVCNNALSGLASGLAETMKGDHAAIHDELVANMLPGVIVVPAGVAALNACQEAQFTLVQASIG